MTNVIHFVPRSLVDASANLASFIEACRPLLNSYPNVTEWERNDWDLGGVVEWSGRGSARIAAIFSNHDTAGDREATPMALPFLNFAKAYFLYSQAVRPSKAINSRLAALRALEKALYTVKGCVRLELVTPEILNIADNLIRERFGAGAAYRVGRELTAIGEFVSTKRLVSTPFQWVSHLGRPSDRNRVGKDADEARAAKLPSQAALDALPRCFLLANDPVDVVISSVAALLCTAPDRVGELFALPAECEVEQDHKGKPIYGIRWWPKKGADPMVKWIAPTMVEVARSAIQN
ncbi:MAG: hypothetical protein ACM33T_06070 [Solirubrobacterales bacterium]